MSLLASHMQEIHFLFTKLMTIDYSVVTVFRNMRNKVNNRQTYS